MSGWRIAVSRLHDLGGGPLQSRAFDTLGPGLGAALKRAHDLGLVWHINGSHWQLTAHGRAFAEGRASVVERKPPPGERGRRGAQIVATWLAALPLPNAVRVSGGIPFNYER